MEKEKVDEVMPDVKEEGESPSKVEAKEEEKKVSPETQIILDINSHINLIEMGIHTEETRYISRLLRQLPPLRKKLTAKTLIQALSKFVEKSSIPKSQMDFLLAILHEDEDAIASASSGEADPSKKGYHNEVFLYLHLLVLLYYIDKVRKTKERTPEITKPLLLLSFNLLHWLHQADLSIFIDLLLAKGYFFCSRAYELAGKLKEIRSLLLTQLRTASLRNLMETKACLLNLLLRNYLEYNLYEQGQKLVSKMTFDEKNCAGPQIARYYYYQGRIKAIQLDYTTALQVLQHAQRKSTPQHRGFRLAISKLLSIVQLLLGEIPEKSVFNNCPTLEPYLKLTQSVKLGDLTMFHHVLETYGNSHFKKDRTYTLIQRLRHNVIKTGLRKISTAYSCISLDDIRHKLQLETADDCEYIVAKAIHDDVIDAVIDHEKQFVKSNQTIDIYLTNEPAKAFNRRIDFCLKLHNEALRTMRYHSIEKSKKELDLFEEEKKRKENELLLLEELRAEEEDDDDDVMNGEF